MLLISILVSKCGDFGIYCTGIAPKAVFKIEIASILL